MMTFDKRQTNIAKGVAVLLLLWHHLFYNDPKNYGKFISVLNINNVPIECLIAILCKICVAIFVFLSGYGLFRSYEKYVLQYYRKQNIKHDLIFIKNHLIKLMSGFWFIYVLFVSLGFCFGRNPIEIYESNIFYGLIDFMGLASVFHTPTMNATWWFMGLIIILYLVYPLLHKLLIKYPEALLLTSFFILLLYFIPQLVNLRIYLFSFVLAMYISYYNAFSKLSLKLNKPIECYYVIFLFFAIFLLMKRMIFINGAEIDGLFALSIVLISFFIFSKIPVLNNVLELFGKYSGSIFMFHTFLIRYYFENIFYSLKYSIIIFITSACLCLLVAICIELVKKYTGYNKLMNGIFKLN